MYIEPRGRSRPWTAEDEEELHALWSGGVRLGVIAAALGRTSEACGRRARLLGFPRDRAVKRTASEIARACAPEDGDGRP